MLYQIMPTYLILINVLGLLIMRLDKKKARMGAWRIPEGMLMSLAVLGGSIGIYLGMYLFRHKTKKPKFFLGIPLVLLLQILGFLELWKQLQ